MTECINLWYCNCHMYFDEGENSKSKQKLQRQALGSLKGPKPTSPSQRARDNIKQKLEFR
jgi:hypothetical protein